ncbi:hypothetical protein, partial [Micrococcus sp. F3Y]|uniref:hypothetical protein n=1 Tax=Micrococcus sp. F3Y TaxID=3402627 RepID=UPI003AF7E38C
LPDLVEPTGEALGQAARVGEHEIWEARAEAAAAAAHPDAVPGFRTPDPTGFHGPAQVAGQAGTGSGTVSDFARAHPGSVSKEQRAIVEEALKTGQIR